jgi:hypothetical protein
MIEHIFQKFSKKNIRSMKSLEIFIFDVKKPETTITLDWDDVVIPKVSSRDGPINSWLLLFLEANSQQGCQKILKNFRTKPRMLPSRIF